MTSAVEYELNDSIGTLRINREARHNALGAEELDAIEDAIATIARDEEIRVLIVTGAGEKTFCAGAALEDLDSGRITPDRFQRVMNRLATLAIPTIARLNGNVYGGGTELALSCDFLIGISEMRLRVPAASIGLCYPPAGIARFVSRLGASAARRMLVAAETLAAEELFRIGFLDYLVPRESLDERVDELAHHLSGLAPLAVSAMKELVAQAESGDLDSQRAAELASRCEASDDLQEGFAALREKRSPKFAGH